MRPQIFINLPVADLKKSVDFYAGIGFTNNPQFSDDTAACMVYSDEIFVMLLTHAKFKEFTSKPIADPAKSVSVINSISVSSVDIVNDTVEKAVRNGGAEPTPARDYGFMWQRSFEDPDGHSWEILFMDMSKFPQQ